MMMNLNHVHNDLSRCTISLGYPFFIYNDHAFAYVVKMNRLWCQIDNHVYRRGLNDRVANYLRQEA